MKTQTTNKTHSDYYTDQNCTELVHSAMYCTTNAYEVAVIKVIMVSKQGNGFTVQLLKFRYLTMDSLMVVTDTLMSETLMRHLSYIFGV